MNGGLTLVFDVKEDVAGCSGWLKFEFGQVRSSSWF